ncbi:MAG: DnaD [Caudoviricetes sp.]|nr:MAG: DnaD [Caudoviricetes sp.]
MINNHEIPNYFSILTAEVRYNKNLKPNEKLLYSEISALSQANGVCWASNNYFSKLYEVDKSTVSRWIKNLKENNLISVKNIYKQGTKEIVKRELRIIVNSQKPIDENVNTLLTKKSIPYCEKNQYPIDEKVKDNNTRFNNTSFNNINYNNDVTKIYNHYEQNGFGTISSKTMKDFEYWIDDFIKIGATKENAVELIIHSLDIAIDNNVRKYSYVNSILKDWENKRYLCKKDVAANDKRKKKNNYNKELDYNNDDGSEYNLDY